MIILDLPGCNSYFHLRAIFLLNRPVFAKSLIRIYETYATLFYHKACVILPTGIAMPVNAGVPQPSINAPNVKL